MTGLAGHAFGSWKSRNGATMWLRDFLPEHLPTARILTYGYDSKLHKSDSNASIRDFAGRFLETMKTARAREKVHLTFPWCLTRWFMLYLGETSTHNIHWSQLGWACNKTGVYISTATTIHIPSSGDLLVLLFGSGR